MKTATINSFLAWLGREGVAFWAIMLGLAVAICLKLIPVIFFSINEPVSTFLMWLTIGLAMVNVPHLINSYKQTHLINMVASGFGLSFCLGLALIDFS